MRLSLVHWALIATAVLHGGLAAAISTIDRDEETPPPTVITIVETPKKKAPPPPPVPPPPPPPKAAPAIAKATPPRAKPAPTPRATPAPAPSAAPVTAPAPAEFGVKLGGASGNGPALPPPPETAPAAEPVKHKELKAAAPADGGCVDPIVKPKPLHVVQPGFTQDAQDAGITGKVRVEITISASGEVTSVRVLEGLGHGLDEAALEAAKASTFSPATKCGEPVATTFTIGMRFTR